jgi:hypothetical protein
MKFTAEPQRSQRKIIFLFAVERPRLVGMQATANKNTQALQAKKICPANAMVADWDEPLACVEATTGPLIFWCWLIVFHLTSSQSQMK